MNDDYDFTGKMEGDIHLSYTANKGHRTRQLAKITNLLALQAKKYSKYTEKTLITAVKDLDKYTDRLAIFAGYLTLYKIETGQSLAQESNAFTKNTQERAEEVYKQIHDHQPKDDDFPAPAQRGGGGNHTGSKTYHGLKARQTKL